MSETMRIPAPRRSMETDEPLPGAIFLARLDGGSWRSRSVSAAQAFAREGSRFTHTGLYAGDGRIVHADIKAGQVVEEDFKARYGGREVLWSDAPIQRYLATVSLPPWGEAELRNDVVEAARALVQSPYAWLDYLAIAAGEWNWPIRDKVRRYVDGRGGLICSSLVVRAFRMAGVEIFPGVRSGDTTPADLALLDEMWVRDQLADLQRRVGAIEERIA